MMKNKIGKNIRFFKAIRSMDQKKVFRKLKERRLQRKKNRMVKEILGIKKGMKIVQEITDFVQLLIIDFRGNLRRISHIKQECYVLVRNFHLIIKP